MAEDRGLKHRQGQQEGRSGKNIMQAEREATVVSESSRSFRGLTHRQQEM